MTKFQKKLLGFLTAWPFAWILLFVVAIFGIIIVDPGGDPGAVFGVGALLFVLIHALTIFLIIALQVFYIVNVFKNENVKKEHQVVWVIALFFGGLFAMPIYWYLNIWREQEDEYGDYKGLAPASEYESADRFGTRSRTEDPVPPEPHSWR
ncbi:MAG: hypothetical protein DWQ47_12570 [Acidobacteria bacterium]|nr:MAG: hypothetical protein DWQ32_14985 [Acidobacteriota bacterium]REJ98400.1 MAG: hypothetical protein DWQ38_17785 [Acidobacteriota bacterium]REK17144.1 MAG: hypothetical protein DWQ43_02830 [Acidobacteriota bacterium]REK43054.1 MAG: hypothetical protein DWQ47_12570 [Acidobacteriota bacterium]